MLRQCWKALCERTDNRMAAPSPRRAASYRVAEQDADRLGGGGSGLSSSAPRIQYARAADGVGIAFWTLGRGTPLVYLAGGPWNHVELWQIPECRRWYERLAQQRMLVRYDVRGTSQSERNVSDFSLEALLLDVE